MKTLKYAVLTFALTVNAVPIVARNRGGGKHEASIHVTGGMTVPISGPSTGGIDGDDFGLKAGVNYAFNLSRRIALTTGVEFANYSGRISYGIFRDTYSERDNLVPPPSRVTYTYRIDNYRELQSLSLLSVPLMVRLKTRLDDNTELYFAGGCKVAFPVSASARISGKLVSSAYFEHEDVDYSGLPQHDLYDNLALGTRTTDIETKPAAILSLESGLRFSLGRALFYVGLNFDCSLNNLKQTSDKHPLNFSDSGVSSESLLNTSFTDRLKITGFGLKFGFGFL